MEVDDGEVGGDPDDGFLPVFGGHGEEVVDGWNSQALRRRGMKGQSAGRGGVGCKCSPYTLC